jgi:alpha-tubulin suppressor-like RCC1 family protein
MPTFYNFTQSGKVYSFDDTFIPSAPVSEGTLWAWGYNVTGSVGDNTLVTRSTPRQESTSNTYWINVSSGGYYTAAIKSDGTLWGWGNCFAGQLGDNTVFTRSTPRQISIASVGGVSGWRQVSCGGVPAPGDGHMAAIRSDGTLWCWGSNVHGQLGDNTSSGGILGANFRSTPRQEFTSSSNWKQVSASMFNTAAIKSDGTLWVWGRNNYGQIGDNTIANRSTPRQISIAAAGGLTGWKQVSTGNGHTAALRTDGTIWSWGRNHFGQIGDNTLVTRSTPRQEVSLSNNWKQVDSCSFNTAAIKTNGTLWVWGRNDRGQIGDNTNPGAVSGTNSRSTPKQEFTLSSNWKQLSNGYNQIAAIKTDGTLWCWGDNSQGGLGDNSIVHRSTPRQISLSLGTTGITGWKQVSSGYYGTTSIIYVDSTF